MHSKHTLKSSQKIKLKSSYLFLHKKTKSMYKQGSPKCSCQMYIMKKIGCTDLNFSQYENEFIFQVDFSFCEVFEVLLCTTPTILTT